MADIFQAFASGRIVKDAVRFSPDKDGYGFTIAVNGISDDETVFLNCSIFGKRTEKLSPYLLKGKRVIVTGNLKKNSYKRNDGSIYDGLKLNVGDINFIGSKNESKAPNQEQNEAEDNDDNLPF